jgi:hypothetical protein
VRDENSRGIIPIVCRDHCVCKNKPSLIIKGTIKIGIRLLVRQRLRRIKIYAATTTVE